MSEVIEIKDKIVMDIKARLGHPVVSIELPDPSIIGFIDLSLEMVSPYVSETKFITKAGSKTIDLRNEDLEIVDVLRVYDTPTYSADSYDIDLFRDRQITGILDDVVYHQKRAQYETRIDRSFRYINGELYLNHYKRQVTIEVLVKPSLDNIDEKMFSWVKSYTLALTKEALGRIRSKYKIANAPADLDGDTLLQEAQEEKRSLEEKLVQEGDGLFMVLR